MRLLLLLLLGVVWADLGEDLGKLYMQRIKQPTCEEGQYKNSNGECQGCPAGSFSSNEFIGDVCLKCPIGSFSDLDGASYCTSCNADEDKEGMKESSDEDWNRYTTKTYGATSKDNCIDLEDVIKETKTGRFDVAVDIAISGVDNMCLPGMKRTLAGVSELAMFGFRITHCDYKDDVDTTTMTFVVSPPATFAFELYGALSYLEAMLAWVKEFIFEQLGPAFAKDVLRLVVDATDMGLDIDIDMLEIDDFRLENFMVRLFPQNLVEKSESFYEVSIDGFKCEENHEIFDAKWRIMETDMFGCAKESSGCAIHVDSCTSAGNVAVATVHVLGVTSAVSEGRKYESNKGFYNDKTFSLIAAGSDCPEDTACERCELGWILGKNGQCEPCPFSTYGENMGEYNGCASCPYRHTTPFWGMSSPDHCLRVVDNLPFAGNLDVSIDAEPQMDMCELRQAKAKMDDTCNDAFSQGEPDFITSYLCGMSKMMSRETFDQMCYVDREWQDVFPAGSLDDLMCFAIQQFVKDENRPCDEDPMEMSFPMSFPNIPLGLEGSDIVVPLLTAAMKTVTMDFSSISDMMDDMMGNIGILDMTAFTGIPIANDIMEMERAVMRGLKVARLDFEPKYEEDSYFCESGEPRHDCNYQWCDWSEQCRHPESDNRMDIGCEFDECNKCDVSYIDNSYKKKYECLLCPEFPEIDNGEKVEMMAMDGKEASYNYKCDERFMLSSDTCGRQTRCNMQAQIENIPVCVPDTCSDLFEDEELTKIPSGRLIETWKNGKDENEHKSNSCPWAQYQCDTDHFFGQENTRSCDEYGLGKPPVCHPISNCTFAIEGGSVTKTYLTESGEPMAEYSCIDPNHYIRGDSYCKYNEWSREYEVGKMMCVPADTCEFPDEIPNGIKEQEGEDDGKKWAQYVCNDGFRSEGSGWSGCDYETGTMQIPNIELMCVPAGTCEFPDEIPNGSKEQEGEDDGKKWARYVCYDGFRSEGSGWSGCDYETGTMPNIDLICKIGCEYAMSDNLFEMSRVEDEAYFYCKAGYTLIGDSNVRCNPETGEIASAMPYCEIEKNAGPGPDNGCTPPEFIDGGYRIWVEPSDPSTAYYACYPRFALKMDRRLLMGAFEYNKAINSGDEGKAFIDSYKWALTAGHCTEDGYLMLPECHPFYEGSSCELPVMIENGMMIEVIKPDYLPKESEMKDWSMAEAAYECHDGTTMQETMHGNKGWCRSDGSYEVPSCKQAGDPAMEKIEFYLKELEGAKSLVRNGKRMGGVVMSRTVDGYGNEKDGWKLACKRNINENMAGAVCRALNDSDFTGGVIYNAKEKLLGNIANDYEFVWVNAECDYDDTLPMSPHCRAQKYDDYKGFCFSDEIAVARCFHDKMTAKVEILKPRKNKFRCALTLLKEDINMLKKLVKNKAVRWQDRIEVHMEVNGQTIEGELSYKRGYFARQLDDATKDIGCAVCKVKIDGKHIAGESICPERD